MTCPCFCWDGRCSFGKSIEAAKNGSKCSHSADDSECPKMETSKEVSVDE